MCPKCNVKRRCAYGRGVLNNLGGLFLEMVEEPYTLPPELDFFMKHA